MEIRMLPIPAGDNPQQTVSGRVVGSNGKPVEGASVLVYNDAIRRENHWVTVGGLALTDQQGEFAYRFRENITNCKVSIVAEGYFPWGIYTTHPGPGTQVYQLREGARVTGRLLKDGNPVADAGIGLFDVGGLGYLSGSTAVTDANGRFNFSGVALRSQHYLIGIMQSLGELGALPRQRVKTGEAGARMDVGDLNLVKGYTISGRVQTADGKPAFVRELTLARTEFTPRAGRVLTKDEELSPSFYGVDNSFDYSQVHPGADGKFEFTGVPGELVSIFLKLKAHETLSSRNVCGNNGGPLIRLLGTVVSNKTDLVIEIESHDHDVVFSPANKYEALIRMPLQGAEGAVGK
jgi:hypothetical protein